MNDVETSAYEQWGILEIMGHLRFAGLIESETIGGAGFIKITVPAVDSIPAFSRIFGTGSVYSITPTTEETAIALANRWRKMPSPVFDALKYASESSAKQEARQLGFEDNDEAWDEDRPY